VRNAAEFAASFAASLARGAEPWRHTAMTQMPGDARVKPPPSVTVAICTRNRSADVAEGLDALAGRLPLVVDSGSSPEHQARLKADAEAFGANHMRVDEAGLSKARNAAALAAESDWIAYLDDDALAAPDWADKLAAALSEAPDTVALIGGRILAGWPVGRDGHDIGPRWRSLLSVIEREDRGHAHEGFNIFGANFCVRRLALIDAGLFPLHLGRIGDRLIGGEESHLIQSLLNLGLEVIYDPSFCVVHKIPAQRLTRKWVLERAYWEGVTQHKLALSTLGALPRHLRRPKLLASLPVLAALSADPSPRGRDAQIRLAMAIGSLRASLA
jgi:glycosyltransferase involved in cell wall biosynthesis